MTTVRDHCKRTKDEISLEGCPCTPEAAPLWGDLRAGWSPSPSVTLLWTLEALPRNLASAQICLPGQSQGSCSDPHTGPLPSLCLNHG